MCQIEVVSVPNRLFASIQNDHGQLFNNGGVGIDIPVGLGIPHYCDSSCFETNDKFGANCLVPLETERQPRQLVRACEQHLQDEELTEGKGAFAAYQPKVARYRLLVIPDPTITPLTRGNRDCGR